MHKEHVEYVIKGDYVELKDAIGAIEYRLKRLLKQTQRIALMADKGKGSTKLTIMLPNREYKPQSPYNHMILAVWYGNDDNEHLKRFSNLVDQLQNLKREIFVGRDLNFLASLYGLSNSVNYPCCWCSFYVDRSRKPSNISTCYDSQICSPRTIGQLDKILNTPTLKHKEKLGVFQKYIWKIEPMNCIPPSLHLKLGFGNVIYAAMENEAMVSPQVESDNFMRLSKRLGFADRLASTDLNGPELKKLCEHINLFRNTLFLKISNIIIIINP